jgi:glycosyltransferase involved in cell wall biosynthesis
MPKENLFDLSIIGIVGIPAAYGGFETLAEQLTLRLGNRYSIQVFCSSCGIESKLNMPKIHNGAKLNYINWYANGWQSIIYDFISLWKGASNSQSLLVLGVSGATLYPLLNLFWPKVKIITNLDGIEWRRQKWGHAARIFLHISEWFAVKYSDIIVSDNKGIQEYVYSTYGRNSRLITYGGDQQFKEYQYQYQYKCKDNIENDNKQEGYYLGICRIEPENNVSTILEAFTKNNNKHLMIVGNWKNSNYSRALFKKYSKYKNIYLINSIYETDKLNQLKQGAKAYIHGHSAGGTNPSLVEAMFFGLPVIVYDINYNRYTTHNQAIYWDSEESLIECLNNYCPKKYETISKKMNQIARESYTWNRVTNDYISIINL